MNGLYWGNFWTGFFPTCVGIIIVLYALVVIVYFAKRKKYRAKTLFFLTQRGEDKVKKRKLGE